MKDWVFLVICGVNTIQPFSALRSKRLKKQCYEQYRTVSASNNKDPDPVFVLCFICVFGFKRPLLMRIRATIWIHVQNGKKDER